MEPVSCASTSGPRCAPTLPPHRDGAVPGGGPHDGKTPSNSAPRYAEQKNGFSRGRAADLTSNGKVCTARDEGTRARVCAVLTAWRCRRAAAAVRGARGGPLRCTAPGGGARRGRSPCAAPPRTYSPRSAPRSSAPPPPQPRSAPPPPLRAAPPPPPASPRHRELRLPEPRGGSGGASPARSAPPPALAPPPDRPPPPPPPSPPPGPATTGRPRAGRKNGDPGRAERRRTLRGKGLSSTARSGVRSAELQPCASRGRDGALGIQRGYGTLGIQRETRSSGNSWRERWRCSSACRQGKTQPCTYRAHMVHTDHDVTPQ